MIVSTSVNRFALVVAVALAAGIGWIAIQDREPLLLALGIGLLLIAPFIRRIDSGLAGSIIRPSSPPARPTLPPDTLGVGLAPDTRAVDPSEPSDEVLTLIAEGDKIGAIKQYREETSVGLKDAKDAVEDFERRWRTPPTA